ncbi:hypothetical protein [Burkholderia cepacia]|uniref:hypothetical protein n=1 Tax=Burkholderia cepacia TaxID=292 RepID=UPI003D665C6C
MTDQHQPTPPAQPHKREWNGTHHPWSYSPHAFRWTGEHISGLNFRPIATEMRAWMLRRGHLSLMPPAKLPTNGGFTNPYTASGVTLALLMSGVINAFHDYATTPTVSDDEAVAEIERIRLYNEVLIYSARLCEVVIKQLLYCTQIPASRYQRMALGQLLESPCPSCKRKNGLEPHLVSLVGTLAHPFHLCFAFEHCAMDHMDLVNKLRNSQAAHSEVQMLNIRSIAESKAQLLHDSNEALNGFVHMLSHLEDLEQKMLVDLAEKGEAINRLKRSGLRAADCNFNLVPGQPFVFNP